MNCSLSFTLFAISELYESINPICCSKSPIQNLLFLYSITDLKRIEINKQKNYNQLENQIDKYVEIVISISSILEEIRKDN